jgi:hypothetical protein
VQWFVNFVYTVPSSPVRFLVRTSFTVHRLAVVSVICLYQGSNFVYTVPMIHSLCRLWAVSRVFAFVRVGKVHGDETLTLLLVFDDMTVVLPLAMDH